MQSYPKNRERNAAGKKSPRTTRLLTVRARPGNPSQGLLCWGIAAFPCALGRGGIRSIKREGDGATPVAAMRLLRGYFRKGRMAVRRSRLLFSEIGPADGWCDAPDDRNYNRPVRLPYPASHEWMMRNDHLYDCCIVLDFNISPRRRGMGSAIFLHIAKPGFKPTEGCIAVSPRVMARMLPYLSTATVLRVLR